MEVIQAALLGIIQGLTEFLPVSSSGHLILAREIFGWELLEDPHWDLVFDVSVHGGTFLAVILYFRRDLMELIRAFTASIRGGIGDKVERRMAWVIIVATIPAAIFGLLGEGPIEKYFRQAPVLIGGFLVLFGILLWLAETLGRKARLLENLGFSDGILVGIGQALALAPGVSRSGITITVGLALGLKRAAAARFSFLLSAPIIGGAAAVHVVKDFIMNAGSLPDGWLSIFGVGFLFAAVSGYLSIHYFLRWLQARSLAPFILYRVALGVIIISMFGFPR